MSARLDLGEALAKARSSANKRAHAGQSTLQDILVEAIRDGERECTISASLVGDADLHQLTAWMRSAGLQVELVSDQRDGDYWRVRGLQ